MGKVEVNIQLPWPPSINHYYRNVGPRTLISREGREYQRRVAAAVAEMKMPPLTRRLRVFMLANPPDKRKRDLDNLIKPTLDALQKGGVFIDDAQIDMLSIARLGMIPGGRVRIKIEEVVEDAARGAVQANGTTDI